MKTKSEKNLLKAAFAFLFVLSLPCLAAATSLELPSAVPADIAWLFSVQLPDSASFTETQVFYNSKLIVTAYDNGSYAIDSSNGQFVLKAFTVSSGGSYLLYVSYLEPSVGSHAIKVISYNGSSIVDEINETVQVNEAFSYNQGELDSLSSQLASLETELDNVDSSLATLSSSFASVESSTEETMRTNLEQMTTALENALVEINSMKNIINQSTQTGTISLIQQSVLDKRVESLEQGADELNANIASLEETIASQNRKINALLEAQSQNPVTGFFGMAGRNSLTILIVLVIAAAAYGAFAFAKKRRGAL